MRIIYKKAFTLRKLIDENRSIIQNDKEHLEKIEKKIEQRQIQLQQDKKIKNELK